MVEVRSGFAKPRAGGDKRRRFWKTTSIVGESRGFFFGFPLIKVKNRADDDGRDHSGLEMLESFVSREFVGVG